MKKRLFFVLSILLLSLLFLISCSHLRPYAQTQILTIVYGSGGSAGGLGGTNLVYDNFSDLNTSWIIDLNGKGIEVFAENGDYFLYSKGNVVGYQLRNIETDLFISNAGWAGKIGIDLNVEYKDINLEKLKAEGKVYYK